MSKQQGQAPYITAARNFSQTPVTTGPVESPCGVEEQSQATRRTAWILTHAGQELLDAATEVDHGYMWEQARAIASRILAACPSA